MPSSRAFPRRARKTFYFIHLWAGLILGAWFTTIGLTGSVLAWRNELIGKEVLWRAQAAGPQTRQVALPLSRVVAAIKTKYPTQDPGSFIFMPTGEYGAYLYFGDGKEPHSTAIYTVDPTSGRACTPVPYDDLWISHIGSLHTDLLLGMKGFIANGIFTLFAVLMLLSGLWLWWPSTIGVLKQRLTVQRGRSLHRTLYSLHSVLGIYLFGVLLLTTLTAVVMVVNSSNDFVSKSIDRLAGFTPHHSRHPKAAASTIRRPASKPLTPDEMVERAMAAMPSASLNSIALPQHPGEPFHAEYVPTRLSDRGLDFDARTGEVLPTQAGGPATSPGLKAMILTGELHYGWFGGVWSKILYTIAGLMPASLFTTGLWMWARRKRLSYMKSRRTNSSAITGGLPIQVVERISESEPLNL
jgi:uncharacterized iron-regulated membrane protein